MPKITFMHLNENMPRIALDPVKVSSQIPEWYKHQPATMNNQEYPTGGQLPNTVKKCQAIFDAMTAGYLLKLPCDLFIDSTVTPPDIQFPQQLQFVQHILLSAHPREQVSHMPIDEDIYLPDILRIHPLWLVGTERGCSSLFLPPMHSEVLPITAVPAIVDTDKFQSDGHLSYLVKKGFKGIVKKGTPIVQVIPFRREDWTHEIIETDDNVINEQRAIVRSQFKNSYRNEFWEKKNYN
jgi:hypothetical protein